MTITITTPPSRIGPGAFVQASCDDPATAWLVANLSDFGSGGGGCIAQEPASPSAPVTLSLGYSNTPAVSDKFAFGSSIGLADGAAVVLQILALDAGFGFLDSAVLGGFAWDASSFQTALLAKIPAGGGGGGGGLLVPTLTLSTSSPIALSNPYVGTGALGLTGILPSAKGMQWQVVAAPAGVGLRLGVLPEYEDRFLQLVAYYSTFGGALVADVASAASAAQGIVLFDVGAPDHVDYWIAPGFAVNFWWLV